MHRLCEPTLTFQNAFAAREIGLENLLLRKKNLPQPGLLKRKIDFTTFHPDDFLRTIERNIPDELISTKNFTDMRTIAQLFPAEITTFFGFESRLNTIEASSDYLFAVSAKKGERETLAYLINNEEGLPKEYFCHPAWKNIKQFVGAWTDPESILYDKILGMWFEFDTSIPASDVPTPSIFIHPQPIQANSKNEQTSHEWITNTALPLLTGRKSPQATIKKFNECAEKLPPDAAIYQIGTMLSRSTSQIKLVIKRMKPYDIIPYLESLGWTDETNQLSTLLAELSQYVTRFVLHIGIDKKVDTKIGIECSFYPDNYNKETQWEPFLEYLESKGLCIEEKCTSLLCFPGSDIDSSATHTDTDSLIPTVKLPNDTVSNKLVRFISHIKISYEPGKHPEAKGYYGVRLFGQLSSSMHQ